MTHRDIIDIARAEYKTRGPKLSIKAIADAAGVSRQAVHKALGNKAKILARFAAEENIPPETQSLEHRVMEAVLAAVADRGFRAATIEDIAERAQVSATTIYRKYKDKDALMTQFVASRAPSSTLEELDLSGDLSRREQLGRLIAHLLRFIDENRELVTIVLSGSREDREYLRSFRANASSTFTQLERFFSGARREGALRADVEPDALARNLFGMIYAASIFRPTPGDTVAADTESILVMFDSIFTEES